MLASLSNGRDELGVVALIRNLQGENIVVLRVCDLGLLKILDAFLKCNMDP